MSLGGLLGRSFSRDAHTRISSPPLRVATVPPKPQLEWRVRRQFSPLKLRQIRCADALCITICQLLVEFLVPLCGAVCRLFKSVESLKLPKRLLNIVTLLVALSNRGASLCQVKCAVSVNPQLIRGLAMTPVGPVR